jgi:Protein of unknown function (DUF1320)
VAYIAQADLENALSPQTILAIFQDDLTVGTPSAAAMADVCARASAMVDSWLAPVYTGPFPIVQSPVPAMCKELALHYAVAFSFERHPDYVRTFGEAPRAERWRRADEMGARLQAAVLRIPDYVADPVPANVGGLVYDTGPRTILDAADGTSHGGDF